MEHTQKYLYLTISPFEGIVASMLPPREFVFHMIRPGAEKSTHQALIIEIDWKLFFDQTDFKELESTVLKNLVPHSDGRPKRTVYVSEYRSLEHVPLPALKNLYLGQKNGLILEIEKAPAPSSMERKRFLFQINAPIKVMVASKLNPCDFSKGYTKEPINIVSFPKIFFIDLKIAGLIHSPDGDIKELMYPEKDDLEKAFQSLELGKLTKMTNRMSTQIYWPMIRTGFFIGDGDEVIFYPYPDEKKDHKHERWFSHSWFDQK